MIKETEHARQRRAERAIDKKDLFEALKHGDEIKDPNCRACKYGRKFRYNGIYYVVDKRKKKEITCYAQRLKLNKIVISNKMQRKINEAKNCIKQQHQMNNIRCGGNKEFLTSNTVIVVDASGSMKQSDVWGAGSRLEAVWICVALDFIAYRIESHNAGLTDGISIILLNDKTKASVLIKDQPTSWELYNYVVDIYNKRSVTAQSHGYYIPSLKKVENLLARHKDDSCALAVYFLSDGRPSDEGPDRDVILRCVETLGMKFGRRLNLTTVGIGNDEKFQFETLKNMVETAKDYGVQSNFVLPSMTTASIGLSLTSTATALHKTQTEMTDINTNTQKKVRQVLRESRKKAREEVVTHVTEDDYFLYPIAKVIRRIYFEWHEDRRRKHSYEQAPMMNGDQTKFVALNKKAFGEGAERYAFRFFEIAKDRTTVVGSPLVAKESRLVLDGREEHRDRFVRTFCESQQLARRIAKEFNDKLDFLHRVDDSTPRVTFLDCSVYELDDVNLGKQSVLVEEKIDHLAWHKWNMNNGYIEGMDSAPDFNHDKMRLALDHLTKIELSEDDGYKGRSDENGHFGGLNNLHAIEEGDDEEDLNSSIDDEEDLNSSIDDEEKCTFFKDKEVEVRNIKPIKFSGSEVAQAFSHFSYHATGKKRLICDLQGVYDEETNMLNFTDPVIHYHDYRKQDRVNVHGRTDMGRKGMAMFFHTHQDCCGYLCRLVNGGFKYRKRNHYNYKQKKKIDGIFQLENHKY